MKSFKLFLEETEDHGLKQHPWQKDPKIGWLHDKAKKDGHLTLYHGTHDRNLSHIAKHGIQAPKEGATAGNVSMTPEPYTAHGYAAMSAAGGESKYARKAQGAKSFRGVGKRVKSTPHEHRSVLVTHIPNEWAKEHMNPVMRGNMKSTSDKLINKDAYDKHKAAGGSDQHHYFGTELRFKKDIPPEFIKGYMKNPVKNKEK